MEIVTFVVGELQNNTYIAYDKNTKEGVVIDPSLDCQEVLDYINQNNLKILYTINTHGHFDHVYCNNVLKEKTGAAIVIHKLDLELLKNADVQAKYFNMQPVVTVEPDKFVNDGDILTFGSCSLQVLHTPGHSPGSICLYSQQAKVVFVGDTIFIDSIGRTDLPGGSLEMIAESITRILELPEDTTIYSGHGAPTTVKEARLNNPYSPFKNK